MDSDDSEEEEGKEKEAVEGGEAGAVKDDTALLREASRCMCGICCGSSKRPATAVVVVVVAVVVVVLDVTVVAVVGDVAVVILLYLLIVVMVVEVVVVAKESRIISYSNSLQVPLKSSKLAAKFTKKNNQLTFPRSDFLLSPPYLLKGRGRFPDEGFVEGHAARSL